MNARFDADEYAVLEAAAQQLGLTTTGYVAEVAVAAACESEAPGGPEAAGVGSAQLARVQRELFAARTAVNRLRAGLDDLAVESCGPVLGEGIAACARSVERLDEVVAGIDRLLRRAEGTRRSS